MKELNKEKASRARARKLMRKLHPEMLRTDLVHHKDLNPLNNSLDNLVIMDRWDHQELHYKLRKQINYSLPTEIAKLILFGGFTEEEARKFIKKCGL